MTVRDLAVVAGCLLLEPRTPTAVLAFDPAV